MVNITIDGQKLQVDENTTVLEAAKLANVNIPTLCYLKDINAIGSCRICLVEIKGARLPQASCVYPVSEGLEVTTNSATIRKARRANLELILSNHHRECLTCPRNKNCELQTLANEMGITDIRFSGENPVVGIDDEAPIVRNNNKCILCRRCVSMCNQVQTVKVIQAKERGFETNIGCAFDMPLGETPCVNCGQCITVCPVGALVEKDSLREVWEAIENPKKHVIVQTAPAVRVALGEEFGLPIGTSVTGKMVTALKRLGFDKVFDTNTAADLTIMEEGTELLERIKENGKLPMITSCSPGWVKFCEHYYPELLDNLSTAKSPHQMFGAILKSYYAQNAGINPEEIYNVSIMPCVAKKFECKREEMEVDGYRDVDAVVTTRELAKMIKEARIDFVNLPDSEFDDPFGGASGAGLIFGATGGVMEAAIRTVAEIISKETKEEIDYIDVRGTAGIKEAVIEVGDKKLKAAVVHGLGNARKLLERVKSGECDLDFIEVMACPGGCVTGGAQPIHSAKTHQEFDIKAERARAIYAEDKNMQIRKSHENPAIKKLYDEFLGEPNGKKSHKYLHTHYKKRENY